MTAQAAGLQVTPLRLDFTAQQRAAQIEVANLGDAPVAVQIKAFSWAQKDGVDDYQPTGDIFFAPPIVNVAPQKKTLVRFRLRAAPPADRETPYRVYFQEVPAATDRPAGSGMTFRVRFGVPAFVHPAKPVYPALSAATLRTADGLVVTVKNSGAAHVRFEDIQLYPVATDQTQPDQAMVAHAPQSLHGTNYLLPGSQDQFLLPLTRGANVAGLKLLIKTDDYSAHAAPGMTPQGWWWLAPDAATAAPRP